MQKTIIAVAAAAVWFAVVIPSPAEAFSNGNASRVQFQITFGAAPHGWFGGQKHNFNRHNPGHGHNWRGQNGGGHNWRGQNWGGRNGGAYHGGGYRMPARAIIRSLRARQFYRISFLQFRRGLYHARARDAYGRRVRLAINPFNGVIVRLRYPF